MRTLARFRRLGPVLLVLAGVWLSGCITLLPKEKAAQLYRFGFAESEHATPPSPAGARYAVRATPINFDRASAGDRILTVQGDGAAYIAGARWVSPASTLFESALAQAFEATAARSRLLATGEPGPADYLLKLDVRRFEVRYRRGAPVARIEIYAALVSRTDPQETSTRTITDETPASSNSVHAIAAAFGECVTRSLADLVAWVDGRGRT